MPVRPSARDPVFLSLRAVYFRERKLASLAPSCMREEAEALPGPCNIQRHRESCPSALAAKAARSARAAAWQLGRPSVATPNKQAARTHANRGRCFAAGGAGRGRRPSSRFASLVPCMMRAENVGGFEVFVAKSDIQCTVAETSFRTGCDCAVGCDGGPVSVLWNGRLGCVSITMEI